MYRWTLLFAQIQAPEIQSSRYPAAANWAAGLMPEKAPRISNIEAWVGNSRNNLLPDCKKYSIRGGIKMSINNPEERKYSFKDSALTAKGMLISPTRTEVKKTPRVKGSR